LARVHGVSAVSRSLRVPYYGLRERVRPGPKASLTQRASRSPESAVFVELKPPMPIAGECCIELEQRDAKMTLRLPAGHGADPLSLIQAFWRRQP